MCVCVCVCVCVCGRVFSSAYLSIRVSLQWEMTEPTLRLIVCGRFVEGFFTGLLWQSGFWTELSLCSSSTLKTGTKRERERDTTGRPAFQSLNVWPLSNRHSTLDNYHDGDVVAVVERQRSVSP